MLRGHVQKSVNLFSKTGKKSRECVPVKFTLSL